MPLYEYHCQQGCEQVVTERRELDDRNRLTQCGECGGWAYRSFSVSRIWAPTRSM